jgi:hypothetical protein
MADTKVEQQSVSLSFSAKEYIPARYVFEMDDRVDTEQTNAGVVRIRKYPAPGHVLSGLYGNAVSSDDGIMIAVTEGAIYETREVREKEVTGVLLLNGDSEMNLPYPVTSGLSYSVEGNAYDIRGRGVSVAIGYNSTANTLLLSRPCYARIKYSYRTTYQILRYFPDVFNDREVYYMPDPSDYGQLIGFTKVPAGIDPITPIIFSITPPEGISAEFELYRIESAAYAKETGLWEKPPGYPDDGSYPNSSETLDSSESVIEIARTHEIGYFTLFNNPSRMEAYRSAPSEALPLDFGKELRFSANAGGVATTGTIYKTTFSDGSSVTNVMAQNHRVQKQEHFDKYKRLLNRAPKMRTVHFDVPIAEPYGSTTAVNDAREVVRIVSEQKSLGADGRVYTNTVIRDIVKEFRVKLKVKAPSRPSIGSATLRNQSNADNATLGMQAARINTMLSLIWEGIDWVHLRRRILEAYDPDLYEIEFDSSFPTN